MNAADIKIYKIYDPGDLDLRAKIKSNLKILLTNSIPYCGFCLDFDVKLTTLNVEACLNPSNETLEQMIIEVLGNEIMDNIPIKFICHQCTENIQSAYNFVSRVNRVTNLLKYYVEQITTQVEEVDKVVDTTDTSDISNTLLIINEYTLDNQKSLNLPVIKFEPKIFEPKMFEPNTLKQDTFQCNYCNEKIKNKSMLRKHIKQHQNNRALNKRFKCPECKVEDCVHYRYLVAFGQPLKDKKKWFKCVDCKYESASKISLIAHTNKMHLKRFPFVCKTCGAHFHSFTILNCHTKAMHAPGNICPYCDKDFETQTEQTLHTKICSTIQLAHKCNKCPASFENEQRLLTHMSNHEKKYKCQICSRMFKQNANYILHIRMHSQGTRIAFSEHKKTCSLCPVETNFENIREYKQHMSKHKSDETHKCIPCNMEFKLKSELSKHWRTANHTLKVKSVLRFTCSECDYSATSASTLESHRNTKHFNMRPFNCRICNKTFASDLLLQNHLYRHQGIKDFKCEKCGADFTTRLGLKKHQFRKHGDSDRNNFNCELCDRSFFHRSLYETHVKYKHTEKTEPCPLCSNLHHNVKALRKHIEKVHARERDLQELIKTEGLEHVFIDRRIHKVK